MANKKVSQLTSKPSVLTTDLFPIADPSTGQLFKTTISDLGTAIGSGVSSVNSLVGAVVLDTDDIQELVSPTNKWFTDTRARAALSASSPLAYNSGTGVFSLPQANGSTNGFLSSADWTTFNNKLSTATAASTYVPYTGATANVDLGLNYSLTAASIIKSGGTSTQFLKADGSIDTNTYLTTSSAASTYLPLTGGTLTGDLTISSTNPRIYLTDTDNNPDYFISNTDGTFTVYDVTNSTSRLTISTLNTTLNTNLRVDGDVLIKQDSVFGGVAGYTAIGSDSAGIYLKSGTATSHAYLVLSGLTTYRNFTLPDATGTLALTSDLSSYLPLSGGTLTGALSGTSATFSDTITNSLAGNSARGLYFTTNQPSGINWYDTDDVEQYSVGIIANSGSGFWGVWSSTSSTAIDRSVAIPKFKIANSGAATFSSSVTASGGLTVGSLGSGSDAIISLANNASGSPRTIYYKASTATINFTSTGGGDLVTITNGGNVGIGTSSPYNPGGGSQTSLEMSGTNYSTIYLSANSATVRGQIGADNLNGWVEVGARTSHPLLLITNNTERMRITSAGNVGIGTTSPQRLLDVRGAVNLSTTSPSVASTSGAYADIHLRTWSGATSSPARITILDNWIDYFATYTDGHRFRNWSSDGVARDLMTITGSGNVGIGTTSPSRLFEVASGGDTGYIRVTGNRGNADGVHVGNIEFYNSNTSRLVGEVRGITGTGGTQSNSGQLAFYTNDVGTYTERMRITSGGRLLVGTTTENTSVSNLQVKADAGAQAISIIGRASDGIGQLMFMNAANSSIQNIIESTSSSFNFYTGSSERMRITSSGGVGINTTPDSGFKLHVNGYVKFNDASGVQLSSGSQYRQIYFDGFSTLYFWNGSNQSNLSSAGAWVNASDASIKKDVTPIKYGLSDLMLLNPRSYKMKTDDLEQIGFIAQEVEQVIPEVVNSDNKGMKGLSYGNMVALLTKSIQELKAELDTLKNK